MCGIFGYFDFSNRSLSEEMVRAMGRRLYIEDLMAWGITTGKVEHSETRD